MDAAKTHRIWAQGATDQVGHRNYLAKLLPHVKACTDPGFEIEFKTMTPSVTTVHALSEARVQVPRQLVGAHLGRRVLAQDPDATQRAREPDHLAQPRHVHGSGEHACVPHGTTQ